MGYLTVVEWAYTTWEISSMEYINAFIMYVCVIPFCYGVILNCVCYYTTKYKEI